MTIRCPLAMLCALVLVTGGARAQDHEEVSVRAVPVEASTISSMLRSADSLMQSDATVLNDSARQDDASTSVVGLQAAMNEKSGISLSGGLDQSLSSSLSDATVRFEQIGTTHSSSRVRLKTVILRLIAGTAAAGAFATVTLLVLARMSGGAMESA